MNSLFAKKYRSWSELENAIEQVPLEKERGDAFEEFVYCYFQLHSDLYQISEIYREKDIPSKYRSKLHLANTDQGVDGLICQTNGNFIAYQAKFRSGRKKPTCSELSTFWSEAEYADYRCIVANCENLPRCAEKKQHGLQVLVDDFKKLDDIFFKNLTILFDDQKPIEQKPIKPDKYQKRMLGEIADGFIKYDKGKFIAACGIGKTLVSLWATEELATKKILFLTPTLMLVKQTLEEWHKHAEKRFSYLCVCSDTSVALERKEDIPDLDVSEVNFPVTTNPDVISKFMKQNNKTVIFSTYNSANSIMDAMKLNEYEFDIIIFDEAHKTAGAKNSEMFSLALFNSNIRSKKRLFMTATERIVKPSIKSKLESINRIIFSMDDEKIYGPVFTRYTFGQAIEDGVISDYKLIISGIDNSNTKNLIQDNRILSNTQEQNISSVNLYKQIILGKAIKTYNFKKTITFHSSVKRARNFIFGDPQTSFELEKLFKMLFPEIDLNNFFSSSVDGNMTVGERNRRLHEFENSEIGVISNARCLTEGVDLPVIDSVYFVDPKNSIIDIVQACGRALRKSRSNPKKTNSFFTIPIIIDDDTDLENLSGEQFETIHNVIQALRDQDERLADWIDHLNISVAKGSTPTSTNQIEISLPEQFDLKSFSKSILLRIAKLNRNPTEYVSSEIIRRSAHTKSFMPLGDYNHNSYRDKLVIPTINKFQNDDDELTSAIIKINNNNLSHTERMKLIEKTKNKKYRLTLRGKKFKNNSLLFEEIMKDSMLNFESKKTQNLYPYRAILEILLKTKKLNYLEFIYGLYTIPDSSFVTLNDSIQIIEYIKNTYNDLNILNLKNREIVLNTLNKKFGINFTYDELWNSTTIKNKFSYFKDHISLFNGIDIKNDEIILDENYIDEINNLLSKSYDQITESR